MFSFIIIGKQQLQRQDYIHAFCTAKGIGKFDLTTLDSVENSFGIAEVRNLQKTAYTKPLQGTEKALVINNAQTITPEAQNALLKLLEEPPNNTYLFLSATTSSFFLPTILSRCKLIVLPEDAHAFSENHTFQYISILETISSASAAEKLALAEKLAGSKGDLSLWLEEMLLFLREKMLSDPENTSYPHILIAIRDARQLSQTTNVSPRMILEHSFLTMQNTQIEPRNSA